MQKTEPLPQFTYAPLLHSNLLRDVKQINNTSYINEPRQEHTQAIYSLICFVIFWSMCSQCSSKNFGCSHSSLKKSLPITSPAAAKNLTLNLGLFLQTFPHLLFGKKQHDKSFLSSLDPNHQRQPNRISIIREKIYILYSESVNQHAACQTYENPSKPPCG